MAFIYGTNLDLPAHFTQFYLGKYFSDHMLYVDYNAESAWSQPTIAPFQVFMFYNTAHSLKKYRAFI